ncbi:MAG: TolC family protein [Treponema sp.]|jgi:outer membrane protein TolC|nr:TolC family protein [Treponema sp.]
MQKKFLFSGLILFAASMAFSQTVNLEQARTLALANSRSLAKYNLAIRSSVLDERSQLYSMLPSISAGYSASMNYMNKNWEFINPVDTLNAGLDIAITQKIFEGGKNFIQKAIGAIATESVRKEALAEYFNVLDAADNAYYAVLEAAATLEAEELSLRAALASLAVAEIRQGSGMINRGDFLKALADKEARENSRDQARRSLSLNRMKLRALTGIETSAGLEQVNFDSYEDLIRILAGISDEDADALYDRFWKLLVQANPSLARAALNSQKAEKNLSLAKRDFSPTISATVFSGGINYSTDGGFTSSSGGGLTIRGSIPVDFWVLSNKIEKSRIARDSSALDYKSAETNLETELQSVLLNAFAYAGTVIHSRLSLEYVEQHFEYVNERYRLSQSSISDLGDAATLLINSRNSHIKARYGFLQALSKLRSLGAIDDEQKLMRLLTGDGN